MVKTIICLDPGHIRGYNRGAYNKYWEGTKMYDLAVMLKEEINKYANLEAFITRKNVDDNPSLAERAAMAKRAGAKCFLSLHTNACNTESVNRVVLYRSVAMPKCEDLGWKLMDAIYNTVSPDIPVTKDKVIQTRYNSYGTDWYGVLRGSTGGSVTASYIIEHIFHTNYKASEWMYSDANLRKIAIAEAKVLAEYYTGGNKSEDSGTTTPTTPSTPSNGTFINYTVVSGDSWWSIAAKKMGSGLKMTELASYNGKTTSSMLHPGDVLKIPTSEVAQKYTNYTVVKGDSWWLIAKKKLGDGSKYKYLANYNGKSTDSMLHPGDVLKIPTA